MQTQGVQESSTTSGLSDYVLSGSSEGGFTIASDFIENERGSFTAVRRSTSEQEWFIGYLNGSGDLVRETLLKSTTGSFINWSTSDIKQVFCEHAPGDYPLLPREITADDKFVSAHITDGNDQSSLTGTRAMYSPFIVKETVSIDGMGIYIYTGAGSAANSIHLALYNSTGNFYPGDIIGEAIDLDPSITGFQSGSFTALKLKPGKYFVASWSDVNPGIAHYKSIDMLDAGLGLVPGSGIKTGFFSINGSLSSMPDPAPASMSSLANSQPTIHLVKV